MKRTYTLFVVILAIASLALALVVQAQDDPSAIEFGDTTTGTLGEDMPSAAFTFNGVTGSYVIISMRSDDFDTYLVLLDSAGEVVAEDDDSGGELNAEIMATLPADDEYVILATSLHAYLSDGMVFAEGDFSLTLEEGDAPLVSPTQVPTSVPMPQDELSIAGSVAIGDSVTGELSNSMPNAGYTFTARAGDSVIITLTSEDFDTYLLLRNADGNDLQTDDDSAGNLNSRIGPFTIPVDGTYTIVVESYRHYNSGEVLTGSYSVSLESGDAPVVQATPVPTNTAVPPPTDSPPADGGELAFGDSVMGSLTDSALSLEYTFTAAAGDQVTITLASDDFDAFLTLLDADGNELAADDDGAGNLDSQITAFTIPADGTYVIIVDSYDHARADSSAIGGFTLSLEGDLPDTPIVMGEGVIEVGESLAGELSAETPGIEYAFTASAGDIVTITLSSTAFDAYLVLLDSNGNELDWDDDSAGDLNSRIGPFEIPADGQYVIQVESFGSATGGEAGVGQFTLELADEMTIPTVTEGTIAIGDVVSGDLSEAAPSVEYIFFGASGDVVTITLTSDDFDTYLYLLDANGFELVFDDDGGGGVNSQIAAFTLPADGMYTVVVDSYDHANMEVVAVGSYTLSLSGDTAVVPIASESIDLGEIVTGFMDGVAIEYAFSATTGDLVTITLESDDFDSYVTLRDASGMDLMYDDDSAGDLNSRITAYSIPNDGVYTIVVDSYSHATGGDPVSGNYTLTLVAAEVWPIEYTQEVEGALDVDSPVAIYAFSGSAGDLVTINLDSSGMSMNMRLEEADGLYVDEAYDGGSIGPIPLPATGDYRITIETYDVYQSQSYSLLISHILPTEIALDYEATTRFDDSGVQYYSFEGLTGDAISVQVNSNGLVDTFVTITGPDGYELYYDDDSGAGFDPEIESLVLPSDGTYSVLVQPYIPGDNGDFTLLIGGHAIPAVDEETQVVRVSDKNPEGLVVFDGVAGEPVLVSARVLVKGSEEPRIEVWQNGQLLASNSIGMVQRVAIEFIVPEDGSVQVMLTGNYYSASVVEFSLERLED